MSDPTLEALRKISRTLHDAGWADPEPATPGEQLTDDRLDELRRASARYVSADDIRVLQSVVFEGVPVAEVARNRGIAPDQVREAVARAMNGLNQLTAETAS